MLSDDNVEENLKCAKDFAVNFGIAFQIRDDLLNILSGKNDIEQGIYTAPVIIAAQENPDLSKEDISDALSDNAIEKTKSLMDNYFAKALSAIEDLAQNEFKEAINNLVDILKIEKSRLYAAK